MDERTDEKMQRLGITAALLERHEDKRDMHATSAMNLLPASLFPLACLLCRAMSAIWAVAMVVLLALVST